jgi:SAM-dependent methyltransferase
MIYTQPMLYDIAFGYRDYSHEVSLLLKLYKEYRHTKNTTTMKKEVEDSINLLELAAGPARHSISALLEYNTSIINSVVCIDTSVDMMKYALQTATKELATTSSLSSTHHPNRFSSFTYQLDDMRHLHHVKQKNAQRTFDAVWILLDSLQHLLTNQDMISCFQSLYDLLEPNGIIVFELPHPKEIFHIGQCTRNMWNVPLDENGDDHDLDNDEYDDDSDDDDNDDDDDDDDTPIKGNYLQIIWGDEDDLFDPIRQIRHMTISMKFISDPNQSKNPKDMTTSTPLRNNHFSFQQDDIHEVVPIRFYTIPEMEIIANYCGYELMTPKYGALDINSDINDDELSYRFIGILRKKTII